VGTISASRHRILVLWLGVPVAGTIFRYSYSIAQERWEAGGGGSPELRTSAPLFMDSPDCIPRSLHRSPRLC
jgi:hypothetical protein